MSGGGWYSEVLADIHDSDYTFLARAGAASAIALLPPPAESGIVVDLGCGSGVTAQILDEVGYSVVGIDSSADMINLARKRVPNGHFRIESIYEADIPDCQAVLALGEVLNYTSEDRTPEAIAKLLRNISRSLHSDGFFLCDIAEPGRGTASAGAGSHASGPNWSMHYRATESADASTLTRTITIDVEPGWQSQLLRRDPLAEGVQIVEAHELALFDAATFASTMATNRLAGSQLSSYDGFDFPAGWSAWLAKPTR